jgi:hypothetical protein
MVFKNISVDYQEYIVSELVFNEVISDIAFLYVIHYDRSYNLSDLLMTAFATLFNPVVGIM